MPHTPHPRRRQLLAATVLVLTLLTVGPARLAPHRAAAATIYGWLCRDSNYGGTCITITQDIGFLGATALGNDSASSVLVYPGKAVSLYVDATYGGVCQTFTVGMPDLHGQPIGNDRASSVRVGATCPAVTLFTDANYGGAYMTSDQYPFYTSCSTAGGVTSCTSLLGSFYGAPIKGGTVSSVAVSPGHSVSLYSYENFAISVYTYNPKCITLSSNTPSLANTALGNDNVWAVWVDPPSPCWHTTD